MQWMMTITRWPASSLAILLICAAGLVAQDPFGGADPFADPAGGQPAGNPFGGAAAPPPQSNPFGGAGAPAGDPFGGAAPAPAPTAQPEQQAADGELPLSPDEDNPVVLTIRDMKPSTPDKLMYAVRTLYEIGRTDEAKFYLQKLLAANVAPNVLVDFHKEYGSGLFMEMSNDHRLEPEGAQLGKAVLDAAFEAARDPQLLDSYITQLSDPNPVVRGRAIVGLKAAHTGAVGPLLNVLGDAGRANEQETICRAVQTLGPEVLPPMTGALESSNPTLRANVLRILGESGNAQTLPYVVMAYVSEDSSDQERQAATDVLQAVTGRVPTKRDAERYLFAKAEEYHAGALPGRIDESETIRMWRWDDEAKTVKDQAYEPGDASRLMASRLARALYRAEPTNVEYRRLFLASTLHAAKVDSGIYHPLPTGEGTAFAEAAALGAPAILDLLQHAIETNQMLAATAAAEILGEIGDESLIQSQGGQPGPLAQALRHGDRRLRMAAADAILKIDPIKPFAGSSFLMETLGYFVRTAGTRSVLIAHPKTEKSQTLVGLVSQLGFQAESASTGRETIAKALRQPDFEMVLISDAIDRPDARETIQQLRRDPRTSRLPVGLMARKDNLVRMKEIADLDPLVYAFPRPHDVQTMSFQAEIVLALAGRDWISYDERLDQAAKALAYFERIAQAPETYSFYDLFRQQAAIQAATSTPSLAVKASTVLGLLGSPDAQRTLVSIASQNARPLPERQAAAEGFETAVRQHGLLLTRPEILKQYDLYNRSERLDVSTQQVLASILDAIELPSKQNIKATP